MSKRGPCSARTASHSQSRDTGQSSDFGAEKLIRNLSDLTSEEQEKLVSDVTRLFLFADAKKQLVKREDVKRILIHYKSPKIIKELIELAKVKLFDLFGFELLSLSKYDSKGNAISGTEQGAYLLRMSSDVKNFLSPVIDQMYYPNVENFGLLMVIIGYLFISGGIDKETFWRDLKRLDIDEHKNHTLFDDCQSVVNTFVEQDYLTLKRVQSKTGGETMYMYFIGPRSYAEIPKKNILVFVAKMCGYQEPDPILLAEIEKEDHSTE